MYVDALQELLLSLLISIGSMGSYILDPLDTREFVQDFPRRALLIGLLRVRSIDAAQMQIFDL